LFRFGAFELDGRSGELRKNGRSTLRLVGQPLELLLHLLERPGEVVTREELRQRLWPADTFVDYDHGLNAAINKLRESLQDAADNPRFIQTIPRRGYRFIAPVALDDAAPRTGGIASQSALPVNETAVCMRDAAEKSYLLSAPQDLPIIPSGYSRLLFALLQAMYLSFYILAMANLGGVDAAVRRLWPNSLWVFVVVILTACTGIAVRLYLLAAAAFGDRGLPGRFQRLFPVLFPLDELWSLSPLLIVDRIGLGLALAATAALVFLPFSQRSVLLMGNSGRSNHVQG
jgi:DNA-binding winged helix-turn-helix (wHTH) protein